MSLMRAKSLHGRVGTGGRRSAVGLDWRAIGRMVEAMLRKYGSTVGSFLVRMGVDSKEIETRIARVFVEAHRRGGCPPVGATSRGVAFSGRARRGRDRNHPRIGRAPESIREFLLLLNPEARAIFILFEINRETSRSIAAAFGLSVEEVHERIAAESANVPPRSSD